MTAPLRPSFGWRRVVQGVNVAALVLVAGLMQIWFAYQDQQWALEQAGRAEAGATAATIEQFVREIERTIRSTIPLTGAGATVTPEQRVATFRQLGRQAPAVTQVVYLDATGHELVRWSRLGIPPGIDQGDYSADAHFRGALNGRTYFGPVYLRNESEPYMTVAVGDSGPEAGVTMAEVNLKLVLANVLDIRVGRTGYAYVVDDSGRLIAHPDLGWVLQERNLSELPPPQWLAVGRRIDPPGWTLFVVQPPADVRASVLPAMLRADLLAAVCLLLWLVGSALIARKGAA